MHTMRSNISKRNLVSEKNGTEKRMVFEFWREELRSAGGRPRATVPVAVIATTVTVYNVSSGRNVWVRNGSGKWVNDVNGMKKKNENRIN